MRTSLSLAFLLASSLELHGFKLSELLIEGPSGSKQLESRQQLLTLLQPFVGQDLNEQLLSDVKSTIYGYYKEQGYPFVVAAIPQQDVSKGVLKVEILEGVVGKISYKGNRWFSDRALSRYIHLQEGQKIHQERLLNDVVSLNRNNFHWTEVAVSPGEKRGTTDVAFVTEDRFPLRVYAGADNTGIDVTGKERYFAGFNWGNAWGIGDQLTYQWTTADSPYLFNSHYLGYTSYLPWYHTLKLYGAYGKIHPKMSDFSSDGMLVQGSGRYVIPFKPLYKDFRSEIAIGGDFKRTNSSLFFAEATGSVPLITKNVNLTQLVLTYDIDYKKESHHLTFNLGGYFSPGAWLPDQTKRDFHSLRAHASPRYAYGTLSLGDTYKHRYGSVHALLRGQAATGPLLPSEQFGLGGYDSVRGYDERDFDADDALCLNFELYSPEIGLFGSKVKNNLSFLAFLDYGVGHDFKNELSGIPSTEWLLSVGPGLRLVMYPYLTARLDYGFQLHRLHLPTQKFGKLHFSVTASY